MSNWEVLAGQNIPIIKSKTQVIGIFFSCSTFLARNLATLKNTLSISHSPRPLAVGPIRNAEIMESLLRIRYTTVECKYEPDLNIGAKDLVFHFQEVELDFRCPRLFVQVLRYHKSFFLC